MSTSVEVCVIHQDEEERKTIRSLLEECGCICFEHASEATVLVSSRCREGFCIFADTSSLSTEPASFLRQIKSLRPLAQVIFLVDRAPVALLVQAMRAGAIDLLERPIDRNLLRDAIDRASIAIDRQSRLSKLSPRELDVLRLLIEGHHNKNIAVQLGISHRTVEIYRARVMDKMSAGSLAELLSITLRYEQGNTEGEKRPTPLWGTAQQ